MRPLAPNPLQLTPLPTQFIFTRIISREDLERIR
jgi:hypothetical protein